MASKKKSKTGRWVVRQSRDVYVKKARVKGYRSRAVYKLREIDEKDRLVVPGGRVLDLGAAPGGWSQYTVERLGPSGRVIAVDVLPMAPIERVECLQGDLASQGMLSEVEKRATENQINLVLSDMAPNLTGVKHLDQANCVALARLAMSVALRSLGPEGRFLVKVFEGEVAQEFRKELKLAFRDVVTRKPAASRSDSAEFYLVASNPWV